MSGVTDNYGFITVAEGEAYDEKIFNANMQAVDKELKKMDYRQASYVPVFGGISNQGTTPVIVGSYVRVGDLVTASFYLKSGAGASLGAGVISVSLPFPISNSLDRMGEGYAGLHSPGVNGSIYLLTPVLSPTGTAAVLFATDNNGKNALVTPGSLAYPFLADDVIRGTVTYRTDAA